jgi:hypothetical protein
MPPDAGAAYGLRVEQFAAREPDSLLRELDADFPLVKPESVGLEVRDGFLGDGHAAATAESLESLSEKFLETPMTDRWTASFPSPQRGRGEGVRVCLFPSPCPLPEGEGD